MNPERNAIGVKETRRKMEILGGKEKEKKKESEERKEKYDGQLTRTQENPDVFQKPETS